MADRPTQAIGGLDRLLHLRLIVHLKILDQGWQTAGRPCPDFCCQSGSLRPIMQSLQSLLDRCPKPLPIRSVDVQRQIVRHLLRRPQILAATLTMVVLAGSIPKQILMSVAKNGRFQLARGVESPDVGHYPVLPTTDN
jgi:hypothetical protein